MIPLFAGGIFIMKFQPDRISLWKSYPEDCDNRGAWIAQTIFENDEPVDVAFLGSSHTINGINDSLASALLSSDKRIRAVNLGYCRFGPEMNIVVLRDLLEHKKPKLIVIELNESVITSSHPMYPYYSGNTDLVPENFFNQEVPSNFYHGFLTRLTAIRNSWFEIPHPPAKVNENRFGYRGYPAGTNPELTTRDQPKMPRVRLLRKMELTYSYAWHEEISKLCLANRCAVCYVYLPAFHENLSPLEGEAELSVYGSIFIPQDSLRQKSFWRDQDHLNDAGAEHMTRWLCSGIIASQILKTDR
jgi:hypothetical protein